LIYLTFSSNELDTAGNRMDETGWELAFGTPHRLSAFGFNVDGRQLEDVRLTGANAFGGVFSSSTFFRAVFDGCLLFECSFLDCQFRDCQLINCAVSGYCGGETLMDACDLRGSVLDLRPLASTAGFTLNDCTITSVLDIAPELLRFASVSRMTIDVTEPASVRPLPLRPQTRRLLLLNHHFQQLRLAVAREGLAFEPGIHEAVRDLEVALKRISWADS
jgi:hypothetical protein